MRKKETYTKNVKVRLTPGQKGMIDALAQRETISSSDVIRRILFDEQSSSPYAIAIQHNLMKNELMNRIQVLDISKSAREKILKELSTVE